MKEINYTKGEWKLLKSDNDYWIVQDNDTIALLYTETTGNVADNARLIAAAPTMYEKLNKIITWLEKQAARDEQQAENSRFITMKEAYMADSKNYWAMAKDLRIATNKVESK